MPFKAGFQGAFLATLLAVSSGCGLMPDFGSDGMSRSEKASLNLQMGVRYMDLGMLDVAKEKLQTAYDLDSRNPEVLNAMAVFYERIKDNEKAEDFYESALGKDPDNYSIKNNFGRFLCDRGNQEKGIALLQESLQSAMNNRRWLAESNIGLCLLQQNNRVQAEEYFRKALQSNPEYAPALKEMLKLSYDNQQYMSARAFLERYMAVAKHTPETLWYAFQTERAMGNYQAADEYQEQLINNFPTSKEAQDIKTAISK
jgi:type IV pilus assembly protein PilF